MKTKPDKLKEAYEHLRSLGKLHTQKEFAEQIDYNKDNLSSAFNGDKRYLTKNLFKKICFTYPDIFNVDYFLSDNGDILKSDLAQKTTQSTDYYKDKYIAELEENKLLRIEIDNLKTELFDLKRATVKPDSDATTVSQQTGT